MINGINKINLSNYMNQLPASMRTEEKKQRGIAWVSETLGAEAAESNMNQMIIGQIATYGA